MLQVVRSFRDKRLFWSYVTLILITFFCVFGWKPAMAAVKALDTHVRVWGMMLQLIGAGTVWYDLTHTATGFGEGPTLRKLWNHVKSVFVIPPAITGTASITLEGASCVSTGRSRAMANPGHPVEVRLARLEKLMDSVEDEIHGVRGEMAHQKSELTSEIKKRSRELRSEIGEVGDKLKQSLVSNVYLLTFGVIWLAAGIILTSIPTEITDFGVWVRAAFR